MFVVFGRVVRSAPIGEQVALCGRCLESTRQSVLAFSEHAHVYFVGIGEGLDIGHAAVCQTCGLSLPIVDRSAHSEAEALGDAFLDAHHAIAVAAGRSPRARAAGCAVGGAGLALTIALSSWLANWLHVLWLLALWPTVFVATAVALREVRFRVTCRTLQRAVEPTLVQLLARTRVDVEDLMETADIRGYDQLRDFLAWTPTERGDASAASTSADPD